MTIIGTGIGIVTWIGGRIDGLDERLRTVEVDVAELKIEIRELRNDVNRILLLLEGEQPEAAAD